MPILKKGKDGEFCARHVRRCNSHHNTARSAAVTPTSTGTCAPSNFNTTLQAESTTDTYCYDNTASCNLQRSSSRVGQNGRWLWKLQPSSSSVGQIGQWIWKPNEPCENNNHESTNGSKVPPLTKSYSHYNSTSYCTPTPDPCAEDQVPARKHRHRVRRRQWHCTETKLQYQDQQKKQQNKKYGENCTEEQSTIACELFENRSQYLHRSDHRQPRVNFNNDAWCSTFDDSCHSHKATTKDSETPLYEVQIHKKYNRRSCAFEISHVTKTIHPTYATYFSSELGCHTQEDQTGASIRAAETAHLVWKSFKRVVDTLGWDIIVQIPTTCTKTVNQRQLQNGWCVIHSSSGAWARFHSAASVLQTSNTNASGFTVEIPALKEPYVASKHILGTNTGWYPGVHSNANIGGSSKVSFDEFGNICLESDGKPPADNAYDTAVQVVRAWQQYAYDWSGGQLVIGGLEAKVDRRCMRITVTAPVVLSNTGSYGCEDLGSKGVRNWFFWHRTNRFCKPGWNKQRHPRKYYQPNPHNIVQCGGLV